MAAGPGGGGEEAAAEKTEFDLVITDVDASSASRSSRLSAPSPLGLKEAGDAVTNLPFTILEGKTKAECEEALKTLEEGGAKVELK